VAVLLVLGLVELRWSQPAANSTVPAANIASNCLRVSIV
jgi:hypothetical protein